MALPPIITSFPFFRGLSGAQSRGNEPASSGDRVVRAEEALRPIDTLELSDLETPDQARKAANDVRSVLERNAALALGLDLKFSF